MNYDIREYVENGRSLFARWFKKLPPVTAARIDKYLRRMAQGNLGTQSPLVAVCRSFESDMAPATVSITAGMVNT